MYSPVLEGNRRDTDILHLFKILTEGQIQGIFVMLLLHYQTSPLYRGFTHQDKKPHPSITMGYVVFTGMELEFSDGSLPQEQKLTSLCNKI